MTDIYWKLNDTLPTQPFTLSVNGEPLILTGATVRFKMWTAGNSATPKVNAVATVVDAQAGRVSYTPVAADTDTADDYEAEFEADFGGGAVISVPNDKNLKVKISDSA